MKESSCTQSKDRAPGPSRRGYFPAPCGLPCSRARFPCTTACPCPRSTHTSTSGLFCVHAGGVGCPHSTSVHQSRRAGVPEGPLVPTPQTSPWHSALGSPGCPSGGAWHSTQAGGCQPGRPEAVRIPGCITHSSAVRQEGTCLVTAAVTTLRRRNLILTAS